MPQYFGKTTKLSEIAIDIYLLLAFVLVIVPVRPILQETIVTSSDFLIGERFAKYDAFPTALLLLQVGTVCSLILLFSQKEKKKASFYILMFVLIAAGAIAVNMRPNYNARISEARAAWTARNYTLLMQKAHEALAVSENNSDKATAYYWMGVAANRMDNPKLAIEYQKKSIKSDPTLGYPYSSIAFAQIALKDYANASQSASLCIQNDKYYAWCYLAMFEYYFYSEVNMKKADEYLSLAERIEPENREIRETRKFFEKDREAIEKMQKLGIKVTIEGS